MKSKALFFVFICVAGFAVSAAETHRQGLRIAHIADPQIGFVTRKIATRSQEYYKRNYQHDLQYVQAMIPQVNAAKPDLVIIAGDLMQNAEDIGAVWPALLKEFNAPVLIAPGNHDMGNNVTAANLERFTTLFGSAWSSVSKNGYRIIVMNSQFWYATDGSTAANTAKQTHDAWLDAEIAAADAAGEKIILCSHIPPFENTVNEADSYFNCPKSMRTTFMDKLIANGIDYWLCGHTHTKTQHQYTNAKGTLNIWTAEAVCENFDGTPPGFHIFEIPEGKTVATWQDIPVALPRVSDPSGVHTGTIWESRFRVKTCELDEIMIKRGIEHDYVEVRAESDRMSSHGGPFHPRGAAVVLRFFDNFFSTGRGRLM